MRARRARRTRTDFFIRFISAVDGTGGRPIRLLKKEGPVGRQCGKIGTGACRRPRSRQGFLDGLRAAGPRDAAIATAGVAVSGYVAAEEAAELASPTRRAVAAVGHEQGGRRQVGGSLGLS